MSTFCIYLELEPYLKQWFVNDLGGGVPVSLPRGSAESDIIEKWLMKRPLNACPDIARPNLLPVFLPSFKSKDVRTYNYLPAAAHKLLRNCIRNRFLVEMWKDLHDFGYIGIRKQDVIMAWMEQHNIECDDTNFNTVAKIYQRKRDVYRNNLYRKKIRDIRFK